MMLMIFSQVRALMTLAFLLDAFPAATANSDGSGPQPHPRQPMSESCCL
jgi:hypothetical protein